MDLARPVPQHLPQYVPSGSLQSDSLQIELQKGEYPTVSKAGGPLSDSRQAKKRPRAASGPVYGFGPVHRQLVCPSCSARLGQCHSTRCRQGDVFSGWHPIAEAPGQAVGEPASGSSFLRARQVPCLEMRSPLWLCSLYCRYCHRQSKCMHDSITLVLCLGKLSIGMDWPVLSRNPGTNMTRLVGT